MMMSFDIELELYAKFRNSYNDLDTSYDKFLREHEGYTEEETKLILQYHEAQTPPRLNSELPKRNRRRVRRYVEACKVIGIEPKLSAEVIEDAYTLRV